MHRDTTQETEYVNWADIDWGRWDLGSEEEEDSEWDDFRHSEGINSEK